MSRRPPQADSVTTLPTELAELYADPEAQAVINRVYRAILADPTPSRDRLLDAGFPVGSLDPSLRALVRHRLIDVAIDGQIAPAPPESALPLLAARIEQHAAALKSSAADLTRLYHDARSGSNRFETEHVRLLYSIDEIGQAVAAAVGRGRSRLLAMRAPTQRIIAVANSAPEVIAAPMCNAEGAVLRARVVYDTRLLEITELPDALGRLGLRAGVEEQRMCPDLPFTVTVIDDDQAVVDLTLPGQVGPVGILLSSAQLVQPILAVAERLWDFASPLPHASSDSGLDPREEQVLAMLATGSSDVTIARLLGTSQRTLERRIRSIMDALGADSRFQAGLLAKQRGWL